eukprot:g1574.t1
MPTGLTREFLRQVVRGSGWSLSEVESLSLEGEGITSLGDSFGGATRLVYLNLARNSLSSLRGVEHLASVSTLVLRENRVEAMSEVGRLANLSRLRDLDLRLNPIMTAAASTFGGEGGRGLNASMSSSGGGGGCWGSHQRPDVLMVLPQLATLNGRRVADDERLPRRNQRYEQQRRGERAESPPRQRRTRQHLPRHQPERRAQQRRPPASVAQPPDRPATDKPPRSATDGEDLAAWDSSLGASGGSGRRRRERSYPPPESAAAASSPHRYRHREQPRSRRQASPPQRGGGGDGGREDGDDDADEEDEFARFFPAAGEAPRVPPRRSSRYGEGPVGVGPLAATAERARDTSPRVLRSGESPTPQDGRVVGKLERSADGGGREVAPDRGRGGGGRRCPYRRPGGSSRATETEEEEGTAEAAAAATAAVRRKRDRPGVGDTGRGSRSLEAGELSELRSGDRGPRALGGDRGGTASAVEGCARDPHEPVAATGRAAAVTFHGGQVDLGRRAVSPPRAAAVFAPPTAGGGGGDDLATLWLELGTNEPLGNSRQPSLPSSLSSSSVAAAAAATATPTTNTSTVSAAARAVEAFRRSTRRLGLPATVAADGDRGGDSGGNARDDGDADSHAPPARSPEGFVPSPALGESSLATVPVETLTAALAATTLTNAAAPSEGSAVPNPTRGSERPDDGMTPRCSTRDHSVARVECHPDGSAMAGAGAATEEVVAPAAAGRAAVSSECDVREMDERWWAREREFDARWAARERDFDARWAAREREFDKRRREESEEFTAEMRSMLLGAHEALISSNAWLVDRLKTVEAAAAAAAKKPGPYSERPPYATASGPAESGAPLMCVSKRAAPPGRAAATAAAAVKGDGVGPSTVPAVVVAGDADEGGESSGDRGRWTRGGDGGTIGSVPCAEEVALHDAAGRLAEEGQAARVAAARTMRSTGVSFDSQGATVAAGGASRRAGVTPPPGYDVGQAGAGGVGGAAAMLTGVTPSASGRGDWGHGDIVTPAGLPAAKASPPGCDSSGGSSAAAAVVVASCPPVAGVGAGDAAAVAPQDTQQPGNGTGSYRGGEGMVGSSREGGVFGGDPEVTVSAAPGV